jgi:hypothetical protein
MQNFTIIRQKQDNKCKKLKPCNCKYLYLTNFSGIYVYQALQRKPQPPAGKTGL